MSVSFLFIIYGFIFKYSSYFINLINGSSEDIKLKDNSFDYVISTLVLCTVHDLEKSINEIMRVLKKGGKFIFIEHVADKRKFQRTIQNVVNPFVPGGPLTSIPERRISNISLEVTLGLRFLHKVIYED